MIESLHWLRAVSLFWLIMLCLVSFVSGPPAVGFAFIWTASAWEWLLIWAPATLIWVALSSLIIEWILR